MLLMTMQAIDMTSEPMTVLLNRAPATRPWTPPNSLALGTTRGAPENMLADPSASVMSS